MSSRATRVFVIVAGLYLVHSAYLGSDASPGLFYVGGVFAHYFGGLVLFAGGLWIGFRAIGAARRATSGAAAPGLLALLLLLASTIASLVLARLHNTSETRWLVWLHIVLGGLSVLVGLWAVTRHASRANSPLASGAARILGGSCMAAVAITIAVAFAVLGMLTPADTVIRNPASPPFEVAGESMGGADGPFFPSSAETSTGGRIPSNFTTGEVLDLLAARGR